MLHRVENGEEVLATKKMLNTSHGGGTKRSALGDIGNASKKEAGKVAVKAKSTVSQQSEPVPVARSLGSSMALLAKVSSNGHPTIRRGRGSPPAESARQRVPP